MDHLTKLSEDGTCERSCSAEVIYIGPCVVAYDVSVDEHEQMFEVTTWPHHEIEDEEDCEYLQRALAAIGAWAAFALPLETFEDPGTGAVTYVFCPLPS